MYAEQYYKLYHQNLYRSPVNYNENLVYLEQALKAPFVNPLNAMAKIETKKEWELYRNLFKMHCNLKMTENYRYMAAEYDKRRAYFYNDPFKEINLKSLEKAKLFYDRAEYYWKEAQKWSKKASQFSFLYLDDVQFWMDENWRIENGELDYGKYISKDLKRVAGVIEDFNAMDGSTYPLLHGTTLLNGEFNRRRTDDVTQEALKIRRAKRNKSEVNHFEKRKKRIEEQKAEVEAYKKEVEKRKADIDAKKAEKSDREL